MDCSSISRALCWSRKMRTSPNSAVGPRRRGRLRLHDNFLQRRQKPFDFFRCVVMSQTDTQKSAIFFHIQPFGEVKGVVIAIPGEEPTFAEPSSELDRCVCFDPYSERRAALIKPLRITDAVKL